MARKVSANAAPVRQIVSNPVWQIAQHARLIVILPQGAETAPPAGGTSHAPISYLLVGTDTYGWPSEETAWSPQQRSSMLLLLPPPPPYDSSVDARFKRQRPMFASQEMMPS